jgi:uncharacterized protein (DUF2345 family)
MRSLIEDFPQGVPFIMEGQVVSVDDPDQMGRVKAWIPSLDGDNYDVEQLPWTSYAPLFGGFTVAYPAGGNPAAATNISETSYGMWAIPKLGSTVFIFCSHGDPAARFYFASSPRLHRNRSLPAGRNFDNSGNPGPFGDAQDTSGNFNPIQPAYNNLRTQFNGNVTASEAVTRGAYERQVAQANFNKDGSEGYSTNPADDSYLDPQTYCIVTPGRHAFIIQDDPRMARMRLKTASGHQIIMDDANERIYISTALGNSWLEMDQDGHVNVFSTDSISVRTGKDFNVYADGNINMEAGKGVNIKANDGDIRAETSESLQIQANSNIVMAACGYFDVGSDGKLHITSGDTLNIHAKGDMNTQTDGELNVSVGGSIFETAGSDHNINAGGSVAQTSAGNFDVNVGGAYTLSAGNGVNIDAGAAAIAPTANEASDASCPDLPADPSVVPGFEPWTRPATSGTRGPNWKP